MKLWGLWFAKLLREQVTYQVNLALVRILLIQHFILCGILAPLTIHVKCNVLDRWNQFKMESKQSEALTEPAVLMDWFFFSYYILDVLICLINNILLRTSFMWFCCRLLQPSGVTCIKSSVWIQNTRVKVVQEVAWDLFIQAPLYLSDTFDQGISEQ